MRVLCLSLIMFCFSMSAQALEYTVYGKIGYLVDQGEDFYGQNTDYLTLKGVDYAGTCGLLRGDILVRISENQERAFSLAMAAQLAGYTVRIVVDDVFKDTKGFCKLKALDIAI